MEVIYLEIKLTNINHYGMKMLPEQIIILAVFFKINLHQNGREGNILLNEYSGVLGYRSDGGGGGCKRNRIGESFIYNLHWG